mmetsp:Transcript_788/g.2034  ORF Transcript_788/g.2034 Transcript_788/m.2034 type:complete len:216 (-) Transcript_788:1016-1663(-)
MAVPTPPRRGCEPTSLEDVLDEVLNALEAYCVAPRELALLTMVPSLPDGKGRPPALAFGDGRCQGLRAKRVLVRQTSNKLIVAHPCVHLHLPRDDCVMPPGDAGHIGDAALCISERPEEAPKKPLRQVGRPAAAGLAVLDAAETSGDEPRREKGAEVDDARARDVNGVQRRVGVARQRALVAQEAPRDSGGHEAIAVDVARGEGAPQLEDLAVLR